MKPPERCANEVVSKGQLQQHQWSEEYMSTAKAISRSTFLDRALLILLGLLCGPTGAIANAASAPTASSEPLYTQDFNAFQNKTLEQKVQELADREEIRELIANYAHRTAHGVSQADLYTDDGVFIVRFPGRAPSITRGREALRKAYAQPKPPTNPALPMIHNELIVITGDEARGLCSNELRWSENGKSMIGSGYYQDRFRRENGHWKFVERDMTFIHWVPLQEGWTTTGTARANTSE
jgi:ketosteroid isomerase-like protein